MKGINKSLQAILFIIASVGIILLGCCAKEEKTLNISALLPLTGSASEFGVGNKNGITLAVENINEKGGIEGRKLKISFEDSQNDPKMAVSALSKILAVKKPDALFVSMSSVSMALKPLIEDNKIPAFCVAATPELTKDAQYMLRLLPTTIYQAWTLAGLIQKEKRKARIAVFYIHDDFGEGFNASFSEAAIKTKLDIIFTSSFEKDGKDFRDVVAKALKENPDLIVMGGYGSALGILIKQLREARYNGPICGTPDMGYPKVLNIVGEKIGEIYIVDFDINYSDEKVKEFVSKHERKFGAKPSLDAFLGYDGISLIANGYENYKRNNLTGLRDGIMIIKSYKGLTGILTVSKNGEIEFPLKFKKL